MGQPSNGTPDENSAGSVGFSGYPDQLATQRAKYLSGESTAFSGQPTSHHLTSANELAWQLEPQLTTGPHGP